MRNARLAAVLADERRRRLDVALLLLDPAGVVAGRERGKQRRSSAGERVEDPETHVRAGEKGSGEERQVQQHAREDLARLSLVAASLGHFARELAGRGGIQRSQQRPFLRLEELEGMPRCSKQREHRHQFLAANAAVEGREDVVGAAEPRRLDVLEVCAERRGSELGPREPERHVRILGARLRGDLEGEAHGRRQ